jgi:homoserine kinase
VTERRRVARAPASSANLGPGFDVLAAAVGMHLELEVIETGDFSVDAGGLEVATDRSNLCVRAFEALHSADGLDFSIRTEIPLARGLGSSAAAIVAGLLAADHMYELGLERDEIYRRAVELEGHPDNVAAALYGGFVACPAADEGGERPPPVLLDPPQGLEAVLVIPDDEVSTAAAREALPDTVAFADAQANVAAMAQLLLGIERSDPGLIGRGLVDRLHQPGRRHLYPRSMEVVEAAGELGAIGATISGAGPTVLVWCFWQDTGKVVSAIEDRYIDWVDIRRVPFTPDGAEVIEL